MAKEGFGYQSACDWINHIEKYVDEDFKSYFNIHKIRYMNTFQFLRNLPDRRSFSVVLDLGGSGLFTGLAKEKLGASSLCVTHFLLDENLNGVGQGDRAFLPLDVTKTSHEMISWNFDKSVGGGYQDKFDLIFCLEIIEHISTDPARFLRDLRAMLKPDGYLILTTPNICSLASLERMLSGQSPIGYPYFKKNRTSDRHNIEYAYGQLSSLISQSGLQVLHGMTVDSWSFPSLAMLNFCKQNNISGDFRGDNLMFMCGVSNTEPVEFPVGIYD